MYRYIYIHTNIYIYICIYICIYIYIFLYRGQYIQIVANAYKIYDRFYQQRLSVVPSKNEYKQIACSTKEGRFVSNTGITNLTNQIILAGRCMAVDPEFAYICFRCVCFVICGSPLGVSGAYFACSLGELCLASALLECLWVSRAPWAPNCLSLG